MIALKKIIVPVDFSDGAKLALKYATTFANEFGAQIHLLHVIEEGALHPGNLADPLDTIGKWEQAGAKQMDDFLGKTFESFDIIKRIKSGLVFETIISYAKEVDANLIILGAHGKKGFIDEWLGGTSYEVARKAPCAVLTVKPHGQGFI